MLRFALCLLLLGSSVATATAVGNVEAWLATSDSLRALGQDAASLDLLKSAQHEYEKEGDPCSAALLAGRRAEIHVDWKNPRTPTWPCPRPSDTPCSVRICPMTGWGGVSPSPRPIWSRANGMRPVTSC